ncbi:MAG: hypothetical protein WC758_05285 [Candidatus Woesearchaeota archaeon]
MEKQKKVDEAGRVGIKVPSVSDIMGKKHPENKFKASPVSATVWLNQGVDSDGKQTNYRTISFERSYIDKEGNWQTTNSLRVGDLPKAILVLSKAYEQIMLKDGGISEDE